MVSDRQEASAYLGTVAASVTPQPLALKRNSLFQRGLQPHNYSLPVVLQKGHLFQQQLVGVKILSWTDNGPHERWKKECSCGCAGIFNAPVALSLFAKIFEEMLEGLPLLLYLGAVAAATTTVGTLLLLLLLSC
uniref:Uncharacterized protein n=1 Tax=Chenopodium quinoa TaxID=63459 RepID=A0A803N7W8_CHEQI